MWVEILCEIWHGRSQVSRLELLDHVIINLLSQKTPCIAEFLNNYVSARARR